MTVSCPDCRSVFRVDPAKVPATGVRARCSVCGGVIAISAGTLPVAVTPGFSNAVQANATVATQTPSRVPAAQHAQRPFTPAVSATSVPMAPSAVPSATAMMTPPAPSGLPGMGRAPSSPSPFLPTPGASSAQRTVGAHASHATPATGKRPINPFLNADPGQRARRLARALVSDLVAYHPQKREEGLRDGTLRQLFREEIKKSYEEYVEQIGRELADGSPHFQDALNEILGGGRKLF
jgi:predicted Zn finger-like uncharacterized protein